MQVFVSRGQLGKTALACAGKCMAKDQWGPLTALLQGAQTALEHQQEPELLTLAARLKEVRPGCRPCWAQLLEQHTMLLR